MMKAKRIDMILLKNDNTSNNPIVANNVSHHRNEKSVMDISASNINIFRDIHQVINKIPIKPREMSLSYTTPNLKKNATTAIAKYQSTRGVKVSVDDSKPLLN